MKYGFCFAFLAVALLLTAIQGGVGYIALVYPAISFAIVSIGYLGVGPMIFGKSPNGKRTWLSIVLLLPYMLLTLMTWHLIRLLSRESAINQLNPDFILSRRLLSSEMPQSVKSVVDLTCELSEPRNNRQMERYLCFPILDASSPTPGELKAFAKAILDLPKPVLIHCAQGHGRTGLVAAAVLIVSGRATNAYDAISIVQSARPGIELNQTQRCALESING